MAGTSGIYAVVKFDTSGGSSHANFAECTSWSATFSAAIHQYASCATAGSKKKIAGTKDVSGSVEGILDPSNTITEQVREGDAIDLLLFFSATRYHLVPAVVESVEQSGDLEEGEVMRWSMSWQGNGAPTLDQTVV